MKMYCFCLYKHAFQVFVYPSHFMYRFCFPSFLNACNSLCRIRPYAWLLLRILFEVDWARERNLCLIDVCHLLSLSSHDGRGRRGRDRDRKRGGKQSLEVHLTISSHTLVLHSLRFKKIIFWFMRSFCLLGCEFVEALSPYEACDITNQIAAGSLKLWYYILGEM